MTHEVLRLFTPPVEAVHVHMSWSQDDRLWLVTAVVHREGEPWSESTRSTERFADPEDAYDHATRWVGRQLFA